MLKKISILMILLFLPSLSLVAQNNGASEDLTKLVNEYKKFGYVGIYKEERKSVPVTTKGLGTTQGAKQMVEEALSIIGEMVINKATSQAFEVIKTQTIKGLKSLNGGEKTFSRTIEALNGIRLEEVMSSVNVLYEPFIGDISILIINRIREVIKDEDIKFLLSALNEVVLNKLKNTQKPIGSITVEIIDQYIINHFIKKMSTDDQGNITYKIPTGASSEKDRRTFCVIVAALAVWKASLLPPGAFFSDVSIKFKLDEILLLLNENEKKLVNEYYPETLAIAMTLFKSFDIPTKIDIRAALHNACDALFDAVFWIQEMEAVEVVSPPNTPVVPPPQTLKDPKFYLYRLRKIVDAVIDKDINSIICELYASLDSLEDRKNRGIQLLGATLLYAQTYLDPKYKDQKIAHQERARILGSLVTDRKEQQEGSFVFSIGGSLRGIFGKSLFYPKDPDPDKKNGPLGVPLGIGADWYLGQSGGVHFDFNIVDLGQFASFSNGKGEVLTPSLADVFSPSVTASFFVNPKYPIFLGVSYGYCPKYYVAADGATKKGFFQFGIAFGIYVPLFDF